MTAEAFLAIPFLVILWCGALIILVYTIDIVTSCVCSIWDTISGLRDLILKFVNRRANR